MKCVVLEMLLDFPAHCIDLWHDRTFVIVDLERFPVGFMHDLDPVEVERFRRNILAVIIAQKPKLNCFLDIVHENECRVYPADAS